MSVVFGLFFRDGRPVSDELEKMYTGMKHFPHEKHAFVAKGNGGFGHMLTYNTPEAVNETMPKWIEEAKLLFVAEGRIDNRDELFESLDVPAGKQAEMPDGDLILEAYLKWGEKCIGRLMGKWSLAAFHTDEQRLFIARDKWDYTAIDYYMDEKVFAFATSSQGLLPLPFIEKEIDELMIARLIVVWPGDFDKTYFKGIRRLLPSHVLRVTREKEALRRYWNYADIPVREGLKLEAYVENLFDNLNKAVVARLRSYKPIAATLSGGMDSSTVCVLAAEYLAKQKKRLRAYSHVPQFTSSCESLKNRFGNEKPFVEAIVAACGNIDAAFLESVEISPIRGIEEAIGLFGEPFHAACNAYWLVDIFTTAAREGYGTLLMGEFGNATISQGGYVDALSLRECFKRRGLKGFVKSKLLKPVLFQDNIVGRVYKRLAFGKRPWNEIAFCTEAFEESLDIAGKIKASGFDPTFKYYFSGSKALSVKIFDVNVSRLSSGTYCGCGAGLELRDPTGDPRVIESALSIPNEIFFGETNKWVLRTMMKGRLPDVVRLNQKKGRQSSDLAGRLYAHREEMDTILAEIVATGFDRIADIERIGREWEKVQSDRENYSVDTAAHFMRPIAAYIMCRMHSAM